MVLFRIILHFIVRQLIICFVIEIDEGLGGREKLKDYDVKTLVQYE